MVSKASDDLPDPDSPVKTMSRSRGQVERDVLEVVLARAADHQSVSHRGEDTGARGRAPASGHGIRAPALDVGGVARPGSAEPVHRVPDQQGPQLGDLVAQQRRLLEAQLLGGRAHLRSRRMTRRGELVGVGTPAAWAISAAAARRVGARLRPGPSGPARPPAGSFGPRRLLAAEPPPSPPDPLARMSVTALRMVGGSMPCSAL